jgi:hypothetical protein
MPRFVNLKTAIPWTMLTILLGPQHTRLRTTSNYH